MTSLILLREWQASQIEFWKPIEGHPGYEVSSFGRIRSYWKKLSRKGRRGFERALVRTPTVLKAFPHWQGYSTVYLYGAGRKRTITTPHRLVAKAFLENPEGLPEVNHINLIKTDNRVDNLEWLSCKANKEHARQSGNAGRKVRHLSESERREIRARSATGETNGALAVLYGVCWRTVWNTVHHVTNKEK